MRTTIEIPQELMEEAMRLSDAKTKSQLIKEALEEYVKNIKIKRLLTFSGSIDLEIDLDILRDRKQFLPMT
ncbi:type II toxin-antitoxin system VapB family antitoxin [Aquiflexum sp.]|uniref:type II toxin-antitoxin system VapB family antitoxin n=1 Tax=Aquiflexum sp. TaxID=1872584 RepID=UPI003593810F